MVGDRGMITSARIEALRELGAPKWITCLRAPAIKAIAEEGSLQLGLFDQVNLAAISHPDYPDERLIACRNPSLAIERKRKRHELLDATEVEFSRIAAAVLAKRLKGVAAITKKVGKVSNRYKMDKHFITSITDESFSFVRDNAGIEAEAALDGIYVIRTSVEEGELSDAAAVEAYKGLSAVERDFRNLKAIDIDLRPIYHYDANRVRAHVFISMLAAYLNWHLRKAWAPLCFTDEEIPARFDPVAAAQRSDAAKLKDLSKQAPDGEALHSFSTLLNHLGTLTRNTVVFDGGVKIEKLSIPTPTQRKAFELIGVPVPTTLGGKSTERSH